MYIYIYKGYTAYVRIGCGLAWVCIVLPTPWRPAIRTTAGSPVDRGGFNVAAWSRGVVRGRGRGWGWGGMVRVWVRVSECGLGLASEGKGVG